MLALSKSNKEQQTKGTKEESGKIKMKGKWKRKATPKLISKIKMSTITAIVRLVVDHYAIEN